MRRTIVLHGAPTAPGPTGTRPAGGRPAPGVPVTRMPRRAQSGRERRRRPPLGIVDVAAAGSDVAQERERGGERHLVGGGSGPSTPPPTSRARSSPSSPSPVRGSASRRRRELRARSSIVARSTSGSPRPRIHRSPSITPFPSGGDVRAHVRGDPQRRAEPVEQRHRQQQLLVRRRAAPRRRLMAVPGRALVARSSTDIRCPADEASIRARSIAARPTDRQPLRSRGRPGGGASAGHAATRTATTRTHADVRGRRRDGTRMVRPVDGTRCAGNGVRGAAERRRSPSRAPRPRPASTGARRAAPCRASRSSGLAKKYPWPRSQCSSSSRSSWSARSMPSATGFRSRSCASLRIAAVSAGLAGVGVHDVHERLVDLQDVDRELLDVVQRRVAGAEVVDREQHAERLQLAEPLDRQLHVRHHHALGDLQDQRGRVAGRSR